MRADFSGDDYMRIALFVVALWLAGCSLTPYKMEIRQGNLISPEMRERVKPGMTQAQVRAILGTPLVNDVFHANRWDYVYRLEQGGQLLESQRLTLYFEAGQLVRLDEGAPFKQESGQ